MPPKRKRSSVVTSKDLLETPIQPPAPASIDKSTAPRQRASRRTKTETNPDRNGEILDGKTALRASPDADEKGEALAVEEIATETPVAPPKINDTGHDVKVEDRNSALSVPAAPMPAKKQKKAPTKSSIAAKKGSDEIKAFVAEQTARKAAEAKIKKEDDGDEWCKRQDQDEDEAGLADDIYAVNKEGGRPPPVNSAYLPLPWKGRLGYACLNTYLRFSNPPVFSSRTCRIASILEHRHPLKDPTQPENATKNRPDKSQPASIERGQRYVEELGLANARDIVKMLRWNDKYGIKFLRLSSEMFPFASHLEYGYKLKPFASEALGEAGKVAAELGHRLSTHPGQFTQLGSPRAEVIANAVRDLEYHDELLTLLKLPPQPNRDAVMILHLGGTFGDKAATLDRFRQNYKNLSASIKQRIVLENDDVSWSVHDLLPLCEELNIPLCLDFHHNNIIFDSSEIREGTLDIMKLYPRIKATWDSKGIKQKMHYSEPTSEAITGRQRRKHSARNNTLPPCPNDMDLMIEAKDKEQAVFELMRRFKLPGWDTFNDIIPYERSDDNKPPPKKLKKKKTKKQIAEEVEEFGKELSEAEDIAREQIPEEEVGMGGKENRVYWPIGMEEWLRPKKREVKKKGDDDEDEMFKNPTPANFGARKALSARSKEPLSEEVKESLRSVQNIADMQRILDDIKSRDAEFSDVEEGRSKDVKKMRKVKKVEDVEDVVKAKKVKVNTIPRKATLKKTARAVPTPSSSSMDGEDQDEDDLSMPDLSDDVEDEVDSKIRQAAAGTAPARRRGGVRGKRKSYAEVEEDIGDYTPRRDASAPSRRLATQ